MNKELASSHNDQTFRISLPMNERPLQSRNSRQPCGYLSQTICPAALGAADGGHPVYCVDTLVHFNHPTSPAVVREDGQPSGF